MSIPRGNGKSNLRLALTFLSSFVGSGHVSTERVLNVARDGGIYVFPPHEFLRSIILGEHEYYDPEASEICNLFDITTHDPREHFLLPQILTCIQRAGDAAGGDGFVAVSDVYRFGQELGFLQEQLAPHIARAYRKRLIEAPPAQGMSGPYRITSIGSFMYGSMIQQFPYIDAMTVDTPITEPSARRAIGDARTIHERLRRGRVFCDYLDSQWPKVAANADVTAPFDWLSSSGALRSNMNAIEERANRRDRDRGPFSADSASPR